MDTYYEIIAGHRRCEACKKLGWRKIICHIIEADDKDAIEISLIENIQRKSINPIEEARAFRKYIDDFGWGGIADLASRIGKSPSYIDKKVKLLELPNKVIESISNSIIKSSTAEELVSLRDKYKQSELGNRIQSENLSSRKVRQIVKNIKTNPIDNYDSKQTFVTRFKDRNEKTQRSFDKSIIALRIAMKKLSSIIEQSQDSWIIYEILMQHRNMLHQQINILIKEKMKL